MSSKYLLKKKPLIVDKELATALGLNESIVLQQIEYWLTKFKETNKTRHYQKGKWWVYNSYREWKTNFPFWSESTIRRAIKSLEDEGILITDNFNKLKIDRTKWYSINYEKLDAYCDDAIVQNEQVDTSERTNGDSKMNKPLPKITTKTNNKDNIRDVDEVWKHYKQAIKGADYNPRKFTNSRKKAIDQLLNDFTLDEIKLAIDNATNHKFMMGDNKDNKFHLLPEKMFKFKTIESYLDYKNGKQKFEEADYYADLN